MSWNCLGSLCCCGCFGRVWQRRWGRVRLGWDAGSRDVAALRHAGHADVLSATVHHGAVGAAAGAGRGAESAVLALPQRHARRHLHQSLAAPAAPPPPPPTCWRSPTPSSSRNPPTSRPPRPRPIQPGTVTTPASPAALVPSPVAPPPLPPSTDPPDRSRAPDTATARSSPPPPRPVPARPRPTASCSRRGWPRNGTRRPSSTSSVSERSSTCSTSSSPRLSPSESGSLSDRVASGLCVAFESPFLYALWRLYSLVFVPFYHQVREEFYLEDDEM